MLCVTEKKGRKNPREKTEVPLAPILEDLGWTRKKMLPSRRPFYWHEGRQLVQIGPPYYEVAAKRTFLLPGYIVFAVRNEGHCGIDHIFLAETSICVVKNGASLCRPTN